MKRVGFVFKSDPFVIKLLKSRSFFRLPPLTTHCLKLIKSPYFYLQFCHPYLSLSLSQPLNFYNGYCTQYSNHPSTFPSTLDHFLKIPETLLRFLQTQHHQTFSSFNFSPVLPPPTLPPVCQVRAFCFLW